MTTELNSTAEQSPTNLFAQQAGSVRVIDLALWRARRRLRTSRPRYSFRPNVAQREVLRDVRQAELAAWQASGGDVLSSSFAN